jgi:hypothetical protein
VNTSGFTDSQGYHVIDSIFYCCLKKTKVSIQASPRQVPYYVWMTPEGIKRSPQAADWLKGMSH